jgi:hypothetical protein
MYFWGPRCILGPQASGSRGSVQVLGLERLAMTRIPKVSPVSTVVFRFWREWSAAGHRWRG